MFILFILGLLKVVTEWASFVGCGSGIPFVAKGNKKRFFKKFRNKNVKLFFCFSITKRRKGQQKEPINNLSHWFISFLTFNKKNQTIDQLVRIIEWCVPSAHVACDTSLLDFPVWGVHSYWISRDKLSCAVFHICLTAKRSDKMTKIMT